MKQYAAIILCFSVCFFVAACTNVREIATNLSAKQSIEMLVTLSRSGIQATREQVSGGRELQYRVIVSPNEYARSLEILHEYGLPRSQDESLEAFTRPKGFVPNSPALAQLRLDHALELRLERALLALPGIVEAKAIVQSERSASTAFGAGAATRGVSLVLKTTTTDSAQVSKEEVQRLVGKAVPGIDSSDVDIRFVPTSISLSALVGGAQLVRLMPFSFRVPSGELMVAGLQIMLLFAGFYLAGMGVGAWLTTRRYNKRRKSMRAIAQADGSRSMFLEASLRENPRTKVSLPQVQEGEG